MSGVASFFPPGFVLIAVVLLITAIILWLLR